MVLSNTAFVNGFDNKHRVLKATIVGTVFSGHPTRTTFGNTLRVIFYMKYAYHLAGIRDYALYVCGDDVLSICENRDRDRFNNAFY